MNDAEREEFLAAANIAVLATVDRKGRPHATPIWYFYDGGEFRLSVGRGSQKHKNIEANPNVTLVVDSRGLPPYAVMVHGTATVESSMSEADHVALAVRYLGEDIGKRYAEATAGGDTVTLRIKPTKVVTYDPRMRG